MIETDTIKIMRYMEWERAKGSINAIITSYTDISAEGMERFDRVNDIANEFKKTFGEEAGID